MADAPVDELLARSDDLTKGWLLALLEQTPLDGMPAILAADLARDGPRLCDAAARALADENDLRRLSEGGALEALASGVGVMTGAGDAEAAMRAVDAFHGVLWAAVREALPSPDSDQIAELAERLGLVVGLIRDAVLRRGVSGAGSRGVPVSASASPPLAGASAEESEVRESEVRESEVRESEPEVRESEPKRRESEPERREYGSEPRAFGPGLEGSESAEPDPPTPRAEDEFEVARRPRILQAVPGRRQDDEASKQEQRQALWIGAFEEELTRAQRTGGQLSLLLTELEDADRVVAVEAPSEVTMTFGQFAQAVREAVRRQDILACESDTRMWVIARDTGRSGAQALAGRIAGKVARAPEWRGAPLSVTIGVAVLHEDGRDSDALIEAAEEARYAAEASGVAVVAEPPREQPE